ncbi:hypothetical protein PsYK624_048830 [Phanerochaete sordida]|uniref:Uncharacterized protein n=1 Tax=Phanerochaete sordida TaxID=48140 RepID=A0A9P3LAU3_9APHY|nr:hypothetical protein PsYK624_048830 [Phanerochaete sordida]
MWGRMFSHSEDSKYSEVSGKIPAESWLLVVLHLQLDLHSDILWDNAGAQGSLLCSTHGTQCCCHAYTRRKRIPVTKPCTAPRRKTLN